MPAIGWRHTDLANITQRRLLPVQIGPVFCAASDPSQLPIGLMAGNQNIARVAHDGGPEEIVRLASKPNGNGARHRHRAHQSANVGLIVRRRPA